LGQKLRSTSLGAAAEARIIKLRAVVFRVAS